MYVAKRAVSMPSLLYLHDEDRALLGQLHAGAAILAAVGPSSLLPASRPGAWSLPMQRHLAVARPLQSLRAVSTMDGAPRLCGGAWGGVDGSRAVCSGPA
jgi:hypothetical protein